MLARGWQSIPERGVVEVMWTIKISMGTNHISGTAAATLVKFCTQVDYIKSQQMDDKIHHPKKDRGQGHVTHFKF